MGHLQHRDGDPDAAESRLQQLIAEFGTRLDEALIRALASDHDPLTSYEDIRSQLAPLAESAAAEEATGFDPSGLSHLSDSDIGRFGGDNVTPESQLSPTELTSISEISDGFDTPCFTHQTDLSEDDKIANLRMIFANFPDHTLKFELKNAGGDVEKAFDALLTRQLLEETGELPKGVDGFYVSDENDRRGKYVKKREHKPGRSQLPVTYSLSPPPPDTDGLVESMSDITVQATRIPGPQSQGPRGHVNVLQPPLAERANASSHLPRAVKTQESRPTNWQTVSSKKKMIKTKTPGPSPMPEPLTTSYAETAAALRRKGGLYRSAAAYYDEKAREEKRMTREGSLAYYAEHVDQQSDSRTIDLHGVPVLEGVRIAKDRVQAWWACLSEGEREHRGVANGLSVVTGVGHHSNVRGDSQLRKAVGAMLKNDGWKFETLTGQFHVTGKV